jgi:F-type H+-transporting ATPase subunit a
MVSPVGGFGRSALFELKPPTRDINMTAALAIMTILIVIVAGFKKRGFKGWFKHLAEPMPMMVPFNLMEYIIKPMSLALRLFGNILGAFIIMQLIEAVAPIGIPPVFSLYFDIIDGLIQALVFSFLTTLYIAESVE